MYYFNYNFEYKFLKKRESFIQKKIQFLYNSLTLNDLNAVYPVTKYLNTIPNSATAQKSTLITSMLRQVMN